MTIATVEPLSSAVVEALLEWSPTTIELVLVNKGLAEPRVQDAAGETSEVSMRLGRK